MFLTRGLIFSKTAVRTVTVCYIMLCYVMLCYVMVCCTCISTGSLVRTLPTRLHEDEALGSKHVEDIKKLNIKILI